MSEKVSLDQVPSNEEILQLLAEHVNELSSKHTYSFHTTKGFDQTRINEFRNYVKDAIERYAGPEYTVKVYASPDKINSHVIRCTAEVFDNTDT